VTGADGHEVKTLDAKLREQLIEIAQAAARERNWEWREPIQITSTAHEGEAAWRIRTNFPMRGNSLLILIRKSDLTVMHAGHLPR